MPKVNGTIEANGLSIRATLSSDGAEYIKAGLSQHERLERLHGVAVSQMNSIADTTSVKRLEERFREE